MTTIGKSNNFFYSGSFANDMIFFNMEVTFDLFSVTEITKALSERNLFVLKLVIKYLPLNRTTNMQKIGESN